MKKTRFIMHSIVLLSIAWLAVLTSCSSVVDKEKEQPNIILFLVDDMGWQDTSVPFWTERTPLNDKYHTPNMECLAQQGMKFTQAYACAVCSPTRVSLMSGMNAARHRVTNWTLRRGVSQDAKDEVLEFPKWNMNGLQTADSIEYAVDTTPLPQVLKDNGYFTIHAGKAHFGALTTPSANPCNLGFDINIAGHAAGGPATYQGLKNYGHDENAIPLSVWAIPGLEKYHGQDINLTEALTTEAKLALDSALSVDKPFFLYMAHYTIHVPIEADNRFYQKYKSQGLDETEARYASMVEGMDKSLGDLMDYLEQKGIDDNTIILFMSDNGGLSAHARGGELHVHNAPLNSGKGSAYEGGIREPMIVKWPGVVQPKTKCDDYLIIEDFYPSILEMAGIINVTPKQDIDGMSFVPMLLQEGSTAADRDLFWHFPNKWGGHGPGIGTTSTIRSGQWKLIYWYRDQHFELFNIHQDIGETNNLAAEHPQIVKELAKKLGDYLRSVNAQRPSNKQNGQIVPWPDEVQL
ncbi:sulfatase [Carboxylicivirga mesophila]|uniref:Sulfatase n=1 Tax=Carboxylicivirga mesophila TaxID=1166478 RepID=A0ABS5K7N9_9BACT|nr:sulfatase [Carboxylicivirga mesophila]MBS2210970.1 sulfatase [Carboxylicivirga mesophila]